VGHTGPSACPSFSARHRGSSSRVVVGTEHALSIPGMETLSISAPSEHLLLPLAELQKPLKSPRQQDKRAARIPPSPAKVRTSGRTSSRLPVPPAAGGAKQVICFDLCDPWRRRQTRKMATPNTPHSLRWDLPLWALPTESHPVQQRGGRRRPVNAGLHDPKQHDH